MKAVLKWFICVAVFFLAWWIFPDLVRSNGYISLVVAGTVLWLVNMGLRPVLKFLSFPITFVTLGLFGLVINALMVELAAFVVPGMSIEGLGGFLVSAVMAIMVSVMNVVLVKKKH